MEKINRTKLRLFLILGWIVSTVALYLIPARVCYQARYTPQPDIEIAREIAKKIGLESDSWFAIISYLYYDQPEIGETKDEVHQVLGLIGPWEITYSGEPKRIELDDRPISGEYQEIIQFSEEDLNRGLHQWVFIYDGNGKLIEKYPFK